MMSFLSGKMTDSGPEKHSKLIRGQKQIGKFYHRLEFLTLQFNCTCILRAILFRSRFFVVFWQILSPNGQLMVHMFPILPQICEKEAASLELGTENWVAMLR